MTTRIDIDKSADLLSSRDTESEVIAAAFRDWEIGNHYFVTLDDKDFNDKILRKIFLALRQTAATSENAPNLETIAFQLRADLDPLGGVDFLWDIKEKWYRLCPDEVTATLKTWTKARESFNLAYNFQKKILTAKEAESAQLIADHANTFLNLAAEDTKDDSTHNTNIDELIFYKDALETQQKKLAGVKIEDVTKTGIYELDEYITGFRPGQLIVIGARPGGGKSTLMMNLIRNLKDKCIAVYTLEMRWKELVQKLLCIESGLNHRDLYTGNLTQDDIAKIYAANKDLITRKIHLDQSSGLKPQQLLMRLKRLKQTMGLDAVFIDYLQLMKPDKDLENNQVNVASISRELKKISKLLDIPVIALAQLNRNSETGTTISEPKVSDLRESGSIEADADTVLLLHTNTNDPSDLQIIVGKNRFGNTGKFRVRWNKQTGLMQGNQQNIDKKTIYEL